MLSIIQKTNWHPIEGDLITRWTNDIDPKRPWPEYPRPQLKRKKWLNLNGEWDYAIVDRSKKKQDLKQWDGKILVPYPVESALSGVKRPLSPKQRLWYRRSFLIPEDWAQESSRLLLHFGAVDWETEIWINDQPLGIHQGGDIPFTFDISDFIHQDCEKANEIIIAVWDPTDKGKQEKGKQKLHPFMIFYNAMSGIWQTVWIEPVNKISIAELKSIADIDKKSILLEISLNNFKSDKELHAEINVFKAMIYKNSEDSQNQGTSTNLNFPIIMELDIPITTKRSPIQIELKGENLQLWSPNSPYLYNFEITLLSGNQEIDHVNSYFGMRKISIQKDSKGIPRIQLNNEFLFQYGPLDQGWWPDGLYTAPTFKAMSWDLEMMKKMGFNMVRKHIKIEPALWYNQCDKLGLLVWQDMPSGGVYGNWLWLLQLFIQKVFKKAWLTGRNKKEIRANYYKELRSMIQNLFNFPSIAVWVPFNEGWGQFQTEKVTKCICGLDSTRLIDSASGWVDYKTGDINSIHPYPGPGIPKLKDDRVLGLTEFGGLGLIIPGHIWKTKRRKWGYRNINDFNVLKEQYNTLLLKLKPLISKGLSAAVYTQITDVEQEVNGLMSYDRKKIKINPDWLRTQHEKLF
ncbi:MAG: glycoside hydrolase family 2 protein [Promethearchaeota archaeon]